MDWSHCGFTGITRNIGRGVLDLVMPPYCVGCERPMEAAELLCADCRARMHLVEEPRCERCGKAVGKYSTSERRCMACRRHPPAFDQATAPLQYEDVVRTLVLKLKFCRASVIVNCFRGPLADHLAIMPWMADIDLIQPVPMHWWKRVRRGYNQAELLAESVSRSFDIPLTRALRRVRHTRPQSRLSRRSRLQNLAGALKVTPPGAVEGKTILLVDDILTTGATCSECARVLKESGAAAVYALTLARA